MLFNTIPFLIFFTIVYFIYWNIGKRFKYDFLILAGAAFYYYYSPIFLLHFLVVICINYFFYYQIYNGNKSLFVKLAVIFNLLNNAGQAMKQPGTIRVQLSGTREAIKIRISDTGSGIPESLREKIFEPFFTTKKVGDGTGLGLSVARNLMREMGGDLELVKGQSEGATFEVTLKKRAS
jgi:signal transduction histidine kinase